MAQGLSRWKPVRRWRRRGAVLGLLLLVLLVHRWVGERVLEDRLGFGAADKAPVRIEVAFVKELAPTAPPTVAPRPVVLPAPAPRRAARPKPAASQPQDLSETDAQAAAAAASAAASAAVAMADVMADASSAPEPAASMPAPASAAPSASAPTLADAASAAGPAAASAGSAASAATAATAASGAASAYDWLPPSTQLNYTLVGDYRGPVEGTAQVRWIRVGAHYQVQVDTRVALVVTRRMTSDGELGAAGLVPKRYDEETETVVTSPRRASVRFEGDHIVLGNGSSVPRPPGAQDAASQLVQLVWAFNMQPGKLVAGGQVAVPIALPRRVDDWVYDILPMEKVHTRFGDIEAYPVKPRRPARPGNVLTVQGWFAPTLQYLPIKLRIEQSEGAWVEMLLERPPLQAAPAAAPAASAAR
jgi:hypothetical protein